MNLREIKEMPVCYIGNEKEKCHESLLRSFHIVEYVKEVLSRNVGKELDCQLLSDTIYLLQEHPADLIRLSGEPKESEAKR